MKTIALSILTSLLFVTAGFSQHFITTWKTNNPGASNNRSITIPTHAGSVYLYDVDWDNDGTFDDMNITGNITHQYAVAGTYTAAIRGIFPRFFSNNYGDKSKLLSVDQWGDGVWTDMESAFYGCSNLVIAATDTPDLSNATSMDFMFAFAGLINQDISFWDVSNITSMSNTFRAANAFNQDLSPWDVSNVTNMQSMFTAATSFNGDLSLWDVSNVTNMQSMFSVALLFNQDISAWDVSEVTNMVSMFEKAETFNQDLPLWDVSKVTNMSKMFSLADKFNGDLSTWDVSSVTSLENMFHHADSFNQPLPWGPKTINVTNMASMFRSAISFNGDISNWNVSSVTDMSFMFENAIAFNQDLSTWVVSSVTDMNAMFSHAHIFNQDISNWDVALVTKMASMFWNAYNFNQNLTLWDVSSVTTMISMFRGASSFNKPLDWGVKIDDVTNMTRIFQGASSFNQDISNWDVSGVKNMFAMFRDATSFNQNLSNWDVFQVTNMMEMFYNASAFNQDLSDWDISSVNNMIDMLSNTNLNINNYDNTLIGWALLAVNPNVDLGVVGLNYCASENARDILMNAPHNWDFIGDTKECSDGVDCSAPKLIDELPFQLINWTTCGFIENYTNNIECIPTGTWPGEDMIWEFTPPANKIVDIILNIPSGFISNLLVAADACFNDTTNSECISTFSIFSGGVDTLKGLSLDGNRTYYIGLSMDGDGVSCGSYDITIYEITPINIWVGPVVGDWYDDTSNWSLGHFPTSEEDVLIPTGKTVTILSGELGYAYALDVEQGGLLDVKVGGDLDVVTY